MKVYLSVLGCKVNQAEVERWARELILAGHRVVDTPAQAELCLVHSCAVTRQAAKKSRQLAHRVARAGGTTVLTGCYAQELLDEGKNLSGVSLLVGTGGTGELLDLLRGSGLLVDTPAQARGEVLEMEAERSPGLRTRAFVKAQDGCDMPCAFCIVPQLRGPSRSRPLGEIVAEVRGLVARGFREVVLTGVQLSSYRDNHARLSDLVRAILTGTRVERLRLSSIAPWMLGEELLGLWADPRLCRHLHLSLQSGCDATLRRMRRPHTTSSYAERLARARAAIPDLAVTTDVIVGFPGETEMEFQESLTFVKAMDFARVHVFPYSPRPGTEAAQMPGQVPEGLKRERVAAMSAVAADAARSFAQRFVGREMLVLWENCRDGVWRGLTDNYLRVNTKSSANLHNQMLLTELTNLTPAGLWGRTKQTDCSLRLSGGKQT